jgi:serine protease DegS
MSKVLSFIVWPALAGLLFAMTLLLSPTILQRFPTFAPTPAPVATPAPIIVPTPVVSYSPAIKKAAPAVVSINAVNTNLVATRSTPEAREYELNQSNSLGSGVIISPDGYIVTSAHIFPKKSDLDPEITLTLASGSEIEGNLVALDEKVDLALVKVYSENLPYLAAINPMPEVGDVVLAIGNPRNIGQSVSFGIVSALWKRASSFVIQTDAAINPGNSGGALIDIEGRLIGINTAIVSESGGSEGIGFAVPAQEALSFLESYLASGPSGYLGVESVPLSLSQGRSRFNAEVQGFLVNGMKDNSPAAKGGFQIGDVITAVNAQKLSITNPDFINEVKFAISLIARIKPGESANFEVFRNGQWLALNIVLTAGEPQITPAIPSN